MLRFKALPKRWIKVTRPGLGRLAGISGLLGQVLGGAIVVPGLELVVHTPQGRTTAPEAVGQGAVA